MNKWLEEGYISDWKTYVKSIEGVSEKIRQQNAAKPPNVA